MGLPMNRIITRCLKVPVQARAGNGFRGPPSSAYLHNACFQHLPTVFPPLLYQKDKSKCLSEMHLFFYYFIQEPGSLTAESGREWRDSSRVVWCP